VEGLVALFDEIGVYDIWCLTLRLKRYVSSFGRILTPHCICDLVVTF